MLRRRVFRQVAIDRRRKPVIAELKKLRPHNTDPGNSRILGNRL
jgi:hypothetical protein